jgi:tetratricopeptide (TPR) repeat protein
LYDKVTKIAPRFIYGWSNLGNTQTAFGDLNAAETSYNTAIDLCYESLQQMSDEGFGVRRCSDLYVLLLNRGSLRLNNGLPKEALVDLLQSEKLRGQPDAIVLQNVARALEINGFYSKADYDYTTAISMTANEVNPFWLRSAIVKFQLGDVKGGFDLFKRVENRFPEAPEVRAAYAVFLSERGDSIAAQQKFLEIPDRQRLKYSQRDYLTKTICWPPAMIDIISKITRAVGDDKRVIS